MKSAIAQVLNTPELLESILVHVDHTTLVRATGVSKHWHDVIKDTPSTRSRLFLAVPSKLCGHRVSEAVVAVIHVNPLLFDTKQLQVINILGRKHPAPQSLIGTTGFIIFDGKAEMMFKQNLTMKKVSPLASCREMLLFDIPVKEIKLQIVYRPRPGARMAPECEVREHGLQHIIDITLRHDEAIRFGQLLKVLEDAKLDGETDVSCTFGINVQRAYDAGVYRVERRVPDPVEVPPSDERLIPLDVEVNAEDMVIKRFGGHVRLAAIKSGYARAIY